MPKPRIDGNRERREGTLRSLLFEEKIGQKDTPMFGGAKDLAEKISAASGNKIKVGSAYTKLSPILSERKGVTKDFQKLMLEAVRNKLTELDHEDQLDWIGAVEKALNDAKARIATESRKEVGFTARISEVSKNATLRLIVPPGYTNPRTGAVTLGELGDPETRANTAAIFLAAVNLIGEKQGQQTDARYIFLYRSKQEVMLFLETLFNILVGKTKVKLPVEGPYTLKDAADILQRLDESAVMQFYVVSPAYCMVPIVLYDPDDQERFHAFLVYFKNGRLDPYEVPKGNMTVWRNFFQDFMSQIYTSYYSGNREDKAQFDSTEEPDLYVQGWLDTFCDFVESVRLDTGNPDRKLEYEMKPPQRILFEAGRVGFIQYAEMYGVPALEKASP